jgi:NitT/TauT family transport system substrate-binding protein
MKLRIGHLSTFYHTAIILMAQRDTNARLGAEAEWKLFGTGPAIMQAFGRGELDLAYIGLPPAIIGIEGGTSVVCVAGGHMEGTVMAGKSRWKGHPEIEGLEAVLKQFLGRRIGVPGKGSIHDVILREYLERYGLHKDIEVRNYPWADLVTEAVATDEVAAAVGTPALAVAIKRFAGGRVLYPTSLLWPNNPSYGIVADKVFLERHRAPIERFLFLHEEAASFLRNDSAGAAKVISGHVGVVDAEFVLETLQVSPKYCARLPAAYVSATMEFVKALKRLGYVKRELSREEIFDTTVIDAVHPEKDHYGDGIRAV